MNPASARKPRGKIIFTHEPLARIALRTKLTHEAVKSALLNSHFFKAINKTKNDARTRKLKRLSFAKLFAEIKTVETVGSVVKFVKFHIFIAPSEKSLSKS